MRQPWSRVAWVAIVVAVLTFLAAANSYLHPFAFPDEFDYWTLARNLVHTGTLAFNGVTPSAYRPPLVAWVLAPFAARGWPMEVVRPMFVIFYSVTGALVGYFLCRIFIFSRWIPACGTAFVLSHPVYFFSAGNLYPQQIMTPLLLFGLALACMKLQTTSALVLRSVSVGVVTAISVLASAPAIFSLFPIFGLLLWEDLVLVRERQVGRAYRSLIAGLSLVLCLGPYLVRNAHDVHPGIYLSLNSGINLLLGNSPRTTPTSGISVDLSNYFAGHETDSEFDLNRHLTTSALANIKQRPGYYAWLYLRKLCAGCSNSVETATHGYNQGATFVLWAYMTFVWIGVGLLILFLGRDASNVIESLDWPLLTKATILILVGYLLTIAGYAIFFTRLRFRMPVDIGLALLAAVGWGVLSIRRRRNAL